jgi:hypothetical protein
LKKKLLIGTPWCSRRGLNKAYGIDIYTKAIDSLIIPDSFESPDILTVIDCLDITPFSYLLNWNKNHKLYHWSSFEARCWHRFFATATARQFILTYARNNNYDYLLWIDSDNPPPKHTLLTLSKYDFPIVSGWYFAKGSKSRMLYNYNNLSKPPKDCLYNRTWVNGGKGIQYNKSHKEEIFEVDWSGLGSCLINKNIINSINFSWNPFCEAHAEDAEFMYKAQLQGFGKVRIVTELKVPHLDEAGRIW